MKKTGAHTTSLVIIILMLMALGIANLYSAGADSFYFSVQLRHLFLGIFIFMVFGWLIPIKHVNTYAYLAFGGITLALIAVLVIGVRAGGAQRWLMVGPIGFQPSELAKLTLAMAVAKFLYQSRLRSYSLRELAPVLFFAIFTFALVFKQPDFGTAGVCLLVAIIQLLFIHIRIDLRSVLLLSLLGTVGMVAGWMFFLRPYQKLRVLNLLDPNLDPSGSGYNSIQSLVAVGSGQQFGKGFLQGTQTQLQFLPARHTDFIFSVFAEEHGFWGCLVVFALFFALTYIALEIARESRDSFNAMLAVGIAGMMLIQFAINVAMVLAIFPVVGMPLPYFSFGGSALLTSSIALGMLVSIDRHNTKGSQSRRLEAA